MKKFISFPFITILVIILILILCFFLNNSNKAKMPKIYITGSIDNMQDKSDKRQITVRYESNDLKFDTYALIKLQGEYSLNFDKKNYNITFYKDSKYDEKQKIDVKWGEYNKYTLKANWTEPFHARSIVTAQIAAQINEKYNILTDSVNNGYTDGFPVEVYVNGEFWGLYTLNMHKDNLFKMDKENENNISIFANDLNYSFLTQKENGQWTKYEIETGKENHETLNKLNKLISFVSDSSDEEFVRDFEKHFNKDSVLNYYCYMKFAHLIDNVIKNIFLVTYDGEIWYMILYDFDESWGNEFYKESEIKDLENKHTEYFINNSTFWKKIERLFRKELNERYAELRREILTKENILSKMNKFYSSIDNRVLEKDYSKWKNKPKYSREYLSSYLDNQIKIFDKEFEYKK